MIMQANATQTARRRKSPQWTKRAKTHKSPATTRAAELPCLSRARSTSAGSVDGDGVDLARDAPYRRGGHHRGDVAGAGAGALQLEAVGQRAARDAGRAGDPQILRRDAGDLGAGAALLVLRAHGEPEAGRRSGGQVGRIIGVGDVLG